ncbi:MAG TPA: thiamine pyrophosphate-binding protein [Streptosporangiaceae bacterium]|jgi:thiamine pyrophosphate-dependent acetolactate synthase large subunit-like protein
MLVAEAVAATLAELGADTAFGVVGSGNFHVTNALRARGVRFIAARHECGAASMADAWARMTGTPGLLSVHQGPGLTNALTGITEAAKSRTPLVVLAPDVAGAAVRSNFRIDVAAVAAAVGAVPERLHSPQSAVADAVRAWRTAARQRRTVLLAMPLDVQAAACDPPAVPAELPLLPAAPAAGAAAALAGLLAGAERPVFVAGRGARGAGPELERLAAACGALLATSAAAKGLFRCGPWDLDVCGGFATPLAAELIGGADLLVAWGCSLNMWTTRHGRLIAPGCRVVQVDDDAAAIGAHRPVQLGVLGDAGTTARAVADALAAGPGAGAAAGGPGRDGEGVGYRTASLRERIAREGRWREVPYADDGEPDRIDSRTLSIALDDLLPAERIVAVDSGNFMGYPSMFLSVPDTHGFCFTQAYQSVGLGLASAIGSAIARPGRLTVAALGDGGALMGISELETVVRLGLPMVIVIYDDEAFGAEVHHFRPDGHPLDTVTFPPADLAQIGRGFGCDGVTVRRREDLAQLKRWLDGPRERPLVIDAKVTAKRGSWWLEEAFRGH